MNDPIERLREHLPRFGRHAPSPLPRELHTPDPVQMLTAKLLLFTGLGTAADALKSARSLGSSSIDLGGDHARPVAWGPAVLGAAAAVAHAVQAFSPSERTRLASRTFDLAVVGVGLLGLADTLAGARRDGHLPSAGPVALASAGLLGILIDRSEIRHQAERERLERRAQVVERFVPRRKPRLDRIVVHV